MRWAQISWNLVIFVFSFFDFLELVTRHVNFDTQSFDRIFQFSLFFGPGMAFWPENRDPSLLKHAISQNIMQFGHFCILIFQNFENCNENLKFDTQSLFRIFQFYSFSGSRIAFWPEIRDPGLLKHAISQHIMQFGDFRILIFRIFENC